MTETGECPLCGHTASTPVAVGPRFRLVRCGHCALAFQDPRPESGAMQRYYEHAYKDAAAMSRTDERRSPVFEEFFLRVPPAGFRRLLDVGCGSGAFMRLAAERGWKTAGVELADEALQQARRLGLTVHSRLADYPEGYFDAVTLWNVVDFFPRPVVEMREIHRVLVPGGRVFLRAPNETYQLAAWRLSRVLKSPAAVAPLLQHAYFFQPVVFRAATLRLLLLSSSFTDIAIWNSSVSAGDPYRERSAMREHVIDVVKRALYAIAQVAYSLSGGRLVIGSSVAALGRKPGESSASATAREAQMPQLRQRMISP